MYQATQINVNAKFQIKKRSLYSVHDQIGLKSFTRLPMKFNHLSKPKLKPKLCPKSKDSVSSICHCGV